MFYEDVVNGRIPARKEFHIFIDRLFVGNNQLPVLEDYCFGGLFTTLINAYLSFYQLDMKSKNTSIVYGKYLQSDHWRNKRQVLFEAQGKYCHECFTVKKISVHHRTYVNIGNEPLEDLEVLCDSCHMKGHQRKDIEQAKLLDIFEFYPTHLTDFGEYFEFLQRIFEENTLQVLYDRYTKNWTFQQKREDRKIKKKKKNTSIKKRRAYYTSYEDYVYHCKMLGGVPMREQKFHLVYELIPQPERVIV